MKMMSRILLLFAVYHPDIGFLGGMSSILCPFVLTFFEEKWQNKTLTKDWWIDIEANCYFCFSTFIQSVSDHYSTSYVGIQHMIQKFDALLARIDPKLSQHLKHIKISSVIFHRLFFCIFTRDIPFYFVLRLFDSYFSFSSLKEALDNFHVYVCVVLVKKFSKELLNGNFEFIVELLQYLLTYNNWSMREMDLLLAEAYQWYEIYRNSHYVNI